MDLACKQRQGGKRGGAGGQYGYPRQLRFHGFLRRYKFVYLPWLIFARVIAGLDPAIHPYAKKMDPRDQPAGDGKGGVNVIQTCAKAAPSSATAPGISPPTRRGQQPCLLT